MVNYLSKDAAIRNLEAFFDGDPSDVVNVDDIFIKTGRNLDNDIANRSWLSNKLTAIKAYNLVTRKYSSRTGKRKLDKLILTSEGRRALGRDEHSTSNTKVSQPSISSTSAPKTVGDVESLLESVNHDVEVLQKRLPSFIVTFSIRPRREIGVSEQIRMGLKRL